MYQSYWDHVAGEALDKALEFIAPFGLIVVRLVSMLWASVTGTREFTPYQSFGRSSTLNGEIQGVQVRRLESLDMSFYRR